MARKPRKKKVAPIPKIWELPIEALEKVVTHLREKYPDSAQLARYEKEMKRRDDGISVEEFYE